MTNVYADTKMHAEERAAETSVHGLPKAAATLAYAAAGLSGASLLLRGLGREAGQLGAAGCFAIAAFGQYWPPAAIIGLGASSVFLVMLDAFGGLPFLLAVRPAERTEMSAVYASYRDVSGIVTPGVAWFVLLVSPLAGIFLAGAAGLGAMALVAGLLHPRLGGMRRTVDG